MLAQAGMANDAVGAAICVVVTGRKSFFTTEDTEFTEKKAGSNWKVAKHNGSPKTER